METKKIIKILKIYATGGEENITFQSEDEFKNYLKSRFYDTEIENKLYIREEDDGFNIICVLEMGVKKSLTDEEKQRALNLKENSKTNLCKGQVWENSQSYFKINFLEVTFCEENFQNDIWINCDVFKKDETELRLGHHFTLENLRRFLNN